MKLSDLSTANKLVIFRELAVDNDNYIDSLVLDKICLTDNYNEFLNFCDKVYSDKDKINEISYTCIDNQLRFLITY